MPFTEAYVSYFTTQTDAPEIFQTYAAYSVLGTCVGRLAYIQGPAGKKIFPNFYTIILAKSGFGKSTVINKAKEIVRDFDPERVWSPNMTDESLTERLVSPTNYGTVVHDEFSEMMAHTRKDYASEMKMILTRYYDSVECDTPPSRVSKKFEGQKIRWPVISILSSTTPIEFFRSVGPDDFTSGFMARFAFVYADRKEREIPYAELPDPDFQREIDLKNEIKKITEFLYDETSKRVTVDRDAKSEFGRWERSWNDDVNNSLRYNNIQANMGRLREYVQKFALLDAAQNYTLSITKDFILHGIEFAENARDNTLHVLGSHDFSNDPYSARLNRVIQSLKVMGANGLTGTEFNRFFNNTRDMENARSTLLVQRFVAIGSVNGSEKIVWRDSVTRESANGDGASGADARVNTEVVTPPNTMTPAAAIPVRHM